MLLLKPCVKPDSSDKHGTQNDVTNLLTLFHHFHPLEKYSMPSTFKVTVLVQPY